MENPLLISQACYVRKPANPKCGSQSKFEHVWSQLEQKVNDFHVKKHEELITSVLEFFSEWPTPAVSDVKPGEAQLCLREDIPTAAVRLGSSISDHSGVFLELSSQLARLTKLVFRLTSADCASLAGIVQKLFHDFIDALGVDDAPRFKRAHINFENFVQLYKLVTRPDGNEPTAVNRSPRKRTAKHPRLNSKKLVIIIEDVAAVKSSILEDLCQILKSHRHEMDSHLVFGLSSTAQSIHKTLTLCCASCLSIRTFTSPPVTETLAGVFDLLVLNKDFPFKLQPEFFDWLSDFVLDHDFSLVTLLHILRVALSLHLSNIDPYVVKALCNPGTDDTVDTALQEHRDIDWKRELLARAFVSLAELRAVSFKDCFLGLQKPDNFIEGDVFRKAERVIRVLSSEELLQRLKNYIELVEDGEVALEFVSFCERLLEDDLDKNLSEKGDTDLSIVKSRFELQEKLRTAAQKKRTTKLDVVRDDVIKYLTRKAMDLDKIGTLPFSKVIYIGNVAKLRDMFAPELRTRLHRALATPSSVLSCSCCRVAPNETSLSLPALSTAYKLHLECGKMINVYDWLQAYQSVKEDKSEVSVAEFLRAVRELHVLGYVKPTTRKMDHVQRLTWGNC